ncbi:hypothetical protein PHYPO_G00173280 [Pangasianodon hypophthalmus]|uniref:Protein S100 n=3 Tax=Pangasiidae TaxID=7999 RepID=A0A5N5JK99_PANHP|nr:hypothetical protein PHYPO_G00173280 [Pangasianodon hypophthalmus]
MFPTKGRRPSINSQPRSPTDYTSPARLCCPLLFFTLLLERTTTAMPSDLEKAMESLILVFHRYASREGNTNTLSRRELRELMENELSNFLRSQKDPGTVDKIMRDLDTNRDGEVSFEEFVSLVVGLSIACEQCYQLHLKKIGGRK